MIRSHARQRTTPWIAGIGPSSTIRARKALCVSLSLGGSTGRRNVDQTIRPLLVETDHPVPQRLAVHARVRRRLPPRAPIEHGGDRQQPARLRGVLLLLRQQANLRRRTANSHPKLPSPNQPPRFPPSTL